MWSTYKLGPSVNKLDAFELDAENKSKWTYKFDLAICY